MAAIADQEEGSSNFFFKIVFETGPEDSMKLIRAINYGYLLVAIYSVFARLLANHLMCETACSILDENSMIRTLGWHGQEKGQPVPGARWGKSVALETASKMHFEADQCGNEFRRAET
jgi:hypothetical protein